MVGAGAGVGAGTGAGGVGSGGAAACGGGGGGGGGGGADSTGCGLGGCCACGAGMTSGAGAGAGTAAGAAAWIELSAVPSKTMETAVSSGSSGGLANGRPISSTSRMTRWTETEIIAPSRRSGLLPTVRLCRPSTPYRTRCSTRSPHPALGRVTAGLAEGVPDGLPTSTALVKPLSMTLAITFMIRP